MGNFRIKIWTFGAGEEGVTARAKIYHNEEITCMSMTSNGRLLVTGSMDQSLKVWDVETGFLTQASFPCVVSHVLQLIHVT